MTARKRTCATCRYWTANGVVQVLGTEKTKRVAGICGGIGSTWDWRLEDGWPAGNERALLMDRNAELLTTGDFFCAEWHADPKASTPQGGEAHAAGVPERDHDSDGHA